MIRLPHRPLYPVLRGLAAATLSLVAAAAFAQAELQLGGLNIDRNAQVEVRAESLQISQSDRSAVFQTNVVIGQGDMRIMADRVEVFYAAESNRIARLEASGGVTFVTASEEAEAREASYDIEGGALVLRGDVLLSQDGNALAADVMEVDLATGAAVLTGNVMTIFGASN